MRQKICMIAAALLCALLLAGCVSPRTPALRCTVLLEDNESLSFPRQSFEVTQHDSLSVTVGVPKGQRISSVSYENCSISSRQSQSEHYDYYTVTLHQIRYSTLVRFTIAPAYTTDYHIGAEEAVSVLEEGPHLYFNALPYKDPFQKEGFAAIGWNTRPDGSGTSVGFGSRIDHRDCSHLDLYVQYLPESPAEDFTWREEGGEAVITGYHGTGDAVIPSRLGGLEVTGIDAGAFGNLQTDLLVLPPTMQTVAAGAFGNVEIGAFYFFDSIERLTEDCFQSYRVGSLHIQAATDPVYSGSYFDTWADKMDYLDSLKNQEKIILFCGSSARFGYDSEKIEQALPDYRVVNMGVFAYTNMLPLAELVLPLTGEGDILLSSPELDAIGNQFCGSSELDKETFCMMESNYDLFSRLDCRKYTSLFGAFSEYSESRKGMTPRSYLESPADYDEDGLPQLTKTYNRQGDYILYRPNNEDRKVFGLKRAYYNPSYLSDADIQGLNGIFDRFAEQGVQVLLTYSPRSSVSISADSTVETARALDTLLRESLHAAVISPIEDSLMDPYYFYGTDNHLSTEGVSIHTDQVIGYLKNTLGG
ncbi:MAG: hypothetical protein ACI4PO_10560 [Faecousia sp.]